MDRIYKTSDSEELNARIIELRAAALIGNIPSSIAYGLINLAIFAAICWPYTQLSTLIGWVAFVAIGTISRGIYVLHLQNQPLKNPNRAINFLAVSAFLNGVGWGAPLYILNGSESPVVVSVLIFILAGMAAGAVIVFASHIKVLMAFTLPMIILNALYFALAGGGYNLLLAGEMLLFLFVSASVSIRSNANYDAALRNQVAAEDQAQKIGIMAKKLEETAIAAQAASTAKSQFLANMSHEIRTPLNGVLGMSQLLENTPLNKEQADYIKTISSSGRALLDIISDVLDISKIETGMMTLKSNPFDLHALIETACNTVSGAAKQKGLSFEISRENSVPQHVFGDEQRIRQVLINLAGNAVKFTENGTVDIQIKSTENDRIHFSVHDTGPGLSSDQCESVFERFVQADNSSTRRHGGSGLGLAISREIITLAGGKIGVESTPGSGSCFWFELPLSVQHDVKQADSVEDSSPPKNLTSCSWRVLVVDDISTNRIVAKAMLERAGHTVAEAENGQNAIDLLNTEAFDVVLMDVHMPVMSGDEAIKTIRSSNTPYKNIPIFAVTADATQEQKEKLLAAGATSYTIKPVNQNVFMAEMNAIMSLVPVRERPTPEQEVFQKSPEAHKAT